jgi:cyclopropane-fatty-acyl-phospholipid synthase
MRLFRPSARLCRELERVLPERPFSIEFWDGGRVPATVAAAPTFHVRRASAIAHALRAPGPLGLGRAYVEGSLETDDIDGAFLVVDDWVPPPISGADRRRLLGALAIAALPAGIPRRPSTELLLRGERHSPARDAEAIRYHYDVGNEFFALFLDESMTYSCALFSRTLDSLEGSWGTQPRGEHDADEHDADRPRPTLEQAQAAKRELICRKLALGKGERVLDVGCGWGSFVIHAAAEHGVQAVGITLSGAQAELARRRVAEAGLEDRVEIRVADYRDLGSAGEHYDAIASIGMVEHVGANQIDLYARQLAGLLAPGGRLLNHGISRLRHGEAEAGPFSERYVFPDAAPLHVSRVTLALERAGVEPLHVEGLREDYAETLSHWIERLDANLEQAERLAGAERVRVWRLYLRAARNGFRTGFTSIFQILGRRA